MRNGGPPSPTGTVPAGDPDLYTRVAVANKVQTLDGRWLSIDGRILFKATVAASESHRSPRAAVVIGSSASRGDVFDAAGRLVQG
jgi:hypothetical protein